MKPAAVVAGVLAGGPGAALTVTADAADLAGRELAAWWVVLVVILLALGWYLSYTAGRLDRLHHKVTAARTALDVQLLRRGAAAVDAARHLDPATALMVADAAAAAIGVAEQDTDELDQRDPLDIPADMESAESDLSRALHLAFAQDVGAALGEWQDDPYRQAALEGLRLACTRVQLARRLYNDAAAQVQRVRRKRVVRWARLAGRAPMPRMIEFDDTVPAGLTS